MTRWGVYPNCDRALARPYAQVRTHTLWQENIRGYWYLAYTSPNALNTAGASHATTGWISLLVGGGTWRTVGIHDAYVGGATRSTITVTPTRTFT